MIAAYQEHTLKSGEESKTTRHFVSMKLDMNQKSHAREISFVAFRMICMSEN